MITLLFDIDGTLVHTGGAGGAALLSSFRDLFKVPRPRDVEYSGRTDRAIGHNMLGSNEIAVTEENWTRLRTEYLSQLPASLSRCRGWTLPGVEALLERLARTEQVALGLLTGNLHEGAKLKLTHYNLVHHFRFGGYGDDFLDRNEVAEMAVKSAREFHRETFEADRVWVIGDTPLDIRCARWVNARVMAVATGTHPMEELADHRPDVLIEDLSDTERIANWLTN